MPGDLKGLAVMQKDHWLLSRPIAHRGLHNDEIPENSFSAFERAIQSGFPIEMDVRIIDDGTLIVFHDDKLARMTGQDGYCSNLSKAGLDELRLGKTDEKIPTFEDFLAFVNGRTPLLIELKNENKVGDLESKVLQMLRAYTGEFAVQSFNPYSMGFFKENEPGIVRGQLSCVFSKKDMGFWRRNFLSKLKLNHVSCPDFISYAHADLPNKYVARTKLPVLAWTVRSQSEADKVATAADNIIFEGFLPEKVNGAV